MRRYGAKLGAITRNAILAGIAKINEYYDPVAQVWAQLTPDQRRAYLEHSPILRSLLDFAERFRG